MFVNDGKLVIDNKYIVDFVGDNEYFSSKIEYILEVMCRSFETQSSSNILDEIYSKLDVLNSIRCDINQYRRDIESEIKKPFDYGPILDYIRSSKEIDRLTLDEKVRQVIGIDMNGIDERFKSLLEYIKHSNVLDRKEIENVILANDKMVLVLDRISSLEAKLDTFSTSRSANKKGQDGEREIFELLSDKLPSRNGYNVESVRGVVNNCDIIVRCDGYENIHIDVKNYECGGKIRTNIVDKFRSDLIGLNTSGIMISLWSGIVSKSEIEIEQLPTGKFAVYLSNTGNNADRLVEFIYLLHKLEKLYVSDGMMMSSETLTRIRNIVSDNLRRINDIRTHLTTSISILNEMNISSINQLIMNAEHKEPETVSDQNPTMCPRCKKTFSTRYKCNQHIKNNSCVK
jgi:hypothetical protein